MTEVERSTVPVNPPRPVTVIFELLEAPMFTDNAPELADILKSVTCRVAVTV